MFLQSLTSSNTILRDTMRRIVIMTRKIHNSHSIQVVFKFLQVTS